MRSIGARLFFIRHAQSVHNKAWLLGIEPDANLIDAPLSEAGREQARGFANVASRMAADFVVVSPLTRAIETAEIAFGETAAPIVCHPLLRERIVHRCDIGRDVDELCSQFPRVDFAVARGERLVWRNPGEAGLLLPEKEQEVEHRCSALLNWLRTRPERRIAIIGHGAYFLLMLGVHLDNCEWVVRELSATGLSN